jgi:hypothetical protein
VPRVYRAQVSHHLWLTGAAWCDFVTWDDRVWPARQRLHIVRVVRDERHIAWYDRCARTFLAEVAAAVQTAAFFRTADLALAREVLAYGTRALQARGGVSQPRRAA